MTIKIFKKENDVPAFELNGEIHEFTYESLFSLIDLVCLTDEGVEYEVVEEMNEYKTLLETIIANCRTDDFKSTVIKLNEKKQELLKADKEYQEK